MSNQSHASGSSFPNVRSVSATATNAAATITLGAVSGIKHYILGILFSYSAAPTGGKLTSTGLNGDQLDIDVTAAGAAPLIAPPAIGASGSAVTITLAAGGSGIVGKLTVFYASLT